MRHAWLLALALSLAPLVAQAQSPTPAFDRAEHVYVTPTGWTDIPTITNDNLTELRARAGQQLKYPFYVVIIRDLNCGPDVTDDCMDQTIEGIAQTWVGQGFNTGTSQLFMLAPNARKFRLHVGDNYRPGGVTYDAYLPIFKANASSGAVKTPATGILAVMDAVDADIAEKGDPAVLAAKALAVKERERRTAIVGLQGELSAMIARLQALGKDPIATAADQAEIAVLVRDATPMTGISDPTMDDMVRMHAALDQMRPVENKLQAQVDVRVSAATWAFLWRMLMWASILGAIALALRAAAERRARSVQLRLEFQGRVTYWDAVLGDIKSRGDDFVIQSDALSQYGGQTRVLVDDLAQLVGHLHLMVDAQEKNVRDAELLVRGAGMFSIAPYEAALAQIDTTFTHSVIASDGSPFAGTTEMEINPSTFVQLREERFAEAREIWTQLQYATTMKNSPAPEALNDPDFKDLLLVAQRSSVFVVPEWYSQHTAAQGQGALLAADQIRVADLVAYATLVTKKREVNARVKSNLQRLMKLIQVAERCCADDFDKPGTDATIIDSAEHDPETTFRSLNSAKSALTTFIGEVVQGASFGDVLDKVETQIKHIAMLRAKLENQVEALIEGPKLGREALGAAYDIRNDARGSIERAGGARAAALTVHQNVPVMSATAQGAMLYGIRKLEDAEKALGEGKALLAVRLAQEAQKAFLGARSDAQGLLRAIQDLDTAKAAYERRLHELPAIEARARARVGKIRSSSRRGRFHTPDAVPVVTEGPVDYLALDRQARQTEEAWSKVETQATLAAKEESSSSSRFSSGSDDNSPSPSPFSGGGNDGGGGTPSFSGGGDY